MSRFIYDMTLFMRGSRGGTEGQDPLKKSQNMGFLSNTGPDPLKKAKPEGVQI